MKTKIPIGLKKILEETPELEGAYLVGGCVRDIILDREVKDFDVEVFGVDYEKLAEVLRRWGRTDLVGRSFGVIKLTTEEGTVDFTIPRRDSKVGPGHKGFAVEFDPSILPKEAAGRRDFTINAMMYDVRRNELLDFYGGREDLKNRVLRHTSEAFVEDPLRVLRGMQFAARFDLVAAPDTVELCRKIKGSYGELAVERVGEEWRKWAGKSVKPSAGLKFLEATEWLEHFPEIAAMKGTPQDAEWHPEGDVFTHTSHCCDAMAGLESWRMTDEESRIVYMFGILAHDFGKPGTTHEAMRDGRVRIVSPGHEEAGGEIAERFLTRIGIWESVRERVRPLVTNHLAHLQELSERAVRRLAKRLEPETIEGLCMVMAADHMGRPPKPAIVPESVKALLAMADELEIKASAPKPILLGRHLIELGMSPGREFGGILEAAFEAQLEGKFQDLPGALQWLAEERR